MNKFIFPCFILLILSMPAKALELPQSQVPAEQLDVRGQDVLILNPEPFTVIAGNTTLVLQPETLLLWKKPSQIPLLNKLTDASSIESVFSFFMGKKNPASEASITYSYRLDKIYSYVKSLSSTIDLPAIEPKINIQNNRAISFTPPQTGVEVEALESSLKILKALEQGSRQSELTIITTQTQNTLTQTNDLGINELIAEGTSNFSGSPKNRQHNIAVGVEKMKGIILAPGEEFSFNKFLGPVEANQGFLPELVIKKEGTIPELGGGLCQVSTTTFRAAMHAGLPITQRRNHAYAVQYYSPQGTDATIYPGVIDLKFINNTPGSLLIWPYFKNKYTLVFDFYGTKDGRSVTLKNPEQYDRKPDGSLKASWERDVTKDGITKTDVFKSVYQPPALFHKVEQFISATPTASTLQNPTQAQ